MFALALLTSTLTALASAHIYDRCELARDLQILGVDRDHIATWVCIAYHESRFDTAAQNYGSGDHGLLQISELYWCGPGKACGAPCSAFRDEDITDDVKCALQIYKEHTRLQGDGFLAWVVYPHHCKQNAKKYIVDCDKNIKNLPVKLNDRARYLKPSDIKYEAKPQIVNNPYRNPLTPRYLAINSIFQGSYVNEFERNYYDNNKQSNWLNFKVDNIDDLTLPGRAVSDNQRSRLTEFTTRPTTTVVDPELIGIKPPSPRKIESNQFRRRKTFSEPLFLKNRISDDQKTSKTTPSPVRGKTESSLSFHEDLSHNIFLNLSPSALTKSESKSPSQEINSSDLSRYHIKFPKAEESSPSAILTYEDLAQNPFLKSLPGFNLKSRSDSPCKVTDQNNVRGYTTTTSRPVTSLRSSKQIGTLRSPEVESNLPKSKMNENVAKVTIEDLSQNPFLSHLLGINKIKPTTESSLNRETKLLDVNKNYRQDFKLTTVKPSTELLFSSSRKLETSTKIPRTGQRGRDRYISNFDSKSTEKPSTERATVTYSTRQYQTISRQRSRINLNDIKSTTALVAIVTSTEKPEVSSTVKPYTNGLYKQNFRIETTTAKTTTNTPKTSYYNITESSKVPLRLTTTPIPQTTSRTEITRMPETSSTTNNLGRSQTNGRQYTMGSTNTTTTTTSNNQQQSKSRPEVTNKPQTTTSTTTKRRLDTNSTPQTTTPKTSGTKTTTHGPQTKSRPVTTSKPQTTILSGSSRRFWAETPNFTSTTLLPRVTRNRPTNLTLTSSTKYYSTSQKPALTSTTIAATAKTTISIFDLYLKPSTQPTFKPFQFTTSNSRRPYKLSIFSGGTTSPPPNYFTTKKPSTEVVRKTNTQNI